MNIIDVKALIETVRDIENDRTFIDKMLSDLHPAYMEKLKSYYPDKIGEGLLNFIESIIPAPLYSRFNTHITLAYAAKVYPFFCYVDLVELKTALIGTVEEIGIVHNKVYGQETDLYKDLFQLAEKNIPFTLTWREPDYRYPKNKTGVLSIGTNLEDDQQLNTGGNMRKKGKQEDYEFLVTLEQLRNYRISYLEISGVTCIQGHLERCVDEMADKWTLYARYAEGSIYLPVAIADCSTRTKAEQLKTLIEGMLYCWAGPTVENYPVV
jgi:hypothetical protein